MSTWIKETDEAIYLMEGGNWISRVTKTPSKSNPKEQVLNIEGLRDWFTRSDFPQAMTVSIGTGSPEPQPVAPPPTEGGDDTGSGLLPEEGGGETTPEEGTPEQPPSSHKGMRIKTISDTYFKLQPKLGSELTDAQKVLVKNGSTFDIEYYIDVGNNHWQIELLNPTIGDQKTTSWFIYTPDTKLVSDMTLTVVSDTLFKLEPKLSTELSDTAKQFVANKTQFRLISHLPASGNHVKVELADTTLGPNKDTVWYVYNPDVKIEGKRQTLQVVSDTIFKAQPVSAGQLGESDKVFVKNGTIFEVSSYADPEKNHVKVSLQGAFLGPQNRNTWYAYLPDISILGTEMGNQPNDSNSNTGQPANPADRGIPLSFPGFSGTYYANDPILWETQYGERGHFTWAEALHVSSSGRYRKPANAGVVYGILRIAKVMEDIRKRYGGKPIQINSWYRDPATNAAVGGASQSRHLSGDAVDFVVPGVSCFDVYADLDRWWGNQGGLASSSVFTHIDTRGYRARWDYGY